VSILFTPIRIGQVEVKNRFVHSATYECMAGDNGQVTDDLIKKYAAPAKGEVGLIIPGLVYVHSSGKSLFHEIGMHDDSLIPGLRKLVDGVHEHGAKIVFQLAHGGQQTSKKFLGGVPLAPSSNVRDPYEFFKPKTMTKDQIGETISAFGQAARRAYEAGADGVQIHAAHGHLINQFLSPFFNHRTDEWGGSEENRFRFLKEVYLKIKADAPGLRMVIAKLNTRDFLPKKGIDPEMAKIYASWLAELGIDAVEVSCGSSHFSFMNMSRGDVPVNEMVSGLPWWMRPLAKMQLKGLVKKTGFEEGYNLEAARFIKPALMGKPLMLVGGMRRKGHMEKVVEQNTAELISMSRPFIHDPFLVKKFKEGKAEEATCISCNRCLAACVHGIPIRCYQKGLPIK
jgi:2,4-dienoyl-CoA reductase-like NADH-dependent reductase (Old Yellow Enzyme family)